MTDVVNLNAEVLEAVDEDDRHIVSVHFTGLINEGTAQGAQPLDETFEALRGMVRELLQLSA